MKNLLLLPALLFTLVFTACDGQAQKDAQAEPSEGRLVEVIDFHSTHRCMTCNAIEEKTRQTLEQQFKDELEAGTLVFKTVNVDEEANYELAREFEASGTALFVQAIFADGSKQKTNLTQTAFMKARATDGQFEQELSSVVSEALQQVL
ncbi:MAG: nitrophenyl compound nitroreductase subunit ArsF family protein [Cyclobacteriaceae bacterium]